MAAPNILVEVAHNQDIKVLKQKNIFLGEQLTSLKAQIKDLEGEKTRLEDHQKKYADTLLTINRIWQQLNGDITALCKRVGGPAVASAAADAAEAVIAAGEQADAAAAAAAAAASDSVHGELPSSCVFLGAVNIPLLQTLPGTATGGRQLRWYNLLRRTGGQHIHGELQVRGCSVCVQAAGCVSACVRRPQRMHARAEWLPLVLQLILRAATRPHTHTHTPGGFLVELHARDAAGRGAR
jgi:hypothetical protein